MFDYIDFGALNAFSITLRLSLAVILGGIIGLERGIKGRAAGMRTYMLVCLGATMVMITNTYIGAMFPYSDPARMGAQVISGIGFLGAGSIIITKDKQVRGLTTAAGLWASACMGLAIGVGFYTAAFIGMFFILFVTSFMHHLDNSLLGRARHVEFYLELQNTSFIPALLDEIRSRGIKINYLEIVRSKSETQVQSALLISLLLPKRQVHYEVLAEFSSLDFIVFAEEV